MGGEFEWQQEEDMAQLVPVEDAELPTLEVSRHAVVARLLLKPKH